MLTRRKSFVRSLYESASLLALLNAVGIFAILGLCVANGTLDAEKVRQIATIVRGAGPSVCEQKAPTEESKPSVTPPKSSAHFSPTELDIVQLEAERLRTELDQRTSLVNSIMLKVRTEREALK